MKNNQTTDDHEPHSSLYHHSGLTVRKSLHKTAQTRAPGATYGIHAGRLLMDLLGFKEDQCIQVH